MHDHVESMLLSHEAHRKRCGNVPQARRPAQPPQLDGHLEPNQQPPEVELQQERGAGGGDGVIGAWGRWGLGRTLMRSVKEGPKSRELSFIAHGALLSPEQAEDAVAKKNTVSVLTNNAPCLLHANKKEASAEHSANYRVLFRKGCKINGE